MQRWTRQSSAGWSITEEQPERRIGFWLELKGRRTGVSSYHVQGVSGQQPSSCLSFNVEFCLVRRSTQTAGEPTSSCWTSDTLTPGSTTPFISKTLSPVCTLTVRRAFMTALSSSSASPPPVSPSPYDSHHLLVRPPGKRTNRTGRRRRLMRQFWYILRWDNKCHWEGAWRKPWGKPESATQPFSVSTALLERPQSSSFHPSQTLVRWKPVSS